LQETNHGPQRTDKYTNEDPIYEEVSSKNKSDKNEIINPNDINLNTKSDYKSSIGINHYPLFDNKTKAKKSKKDVKDILKDDQVQKIYSEVKKTMFKKAQD